MIRSLPMRLLMLVFGAVCVAAGVIAFGAVSLLLIPFGLAMVAMGLDRPTKEGSLEGVRAQEGGTAVEISAARERLIVFCGAGMALSGLGLALVEDGLAWRLLGGAAFLLFGTFAVLGARRNRHGRSIILLTPEAVIQRNRLGVLHIPWEAVELVQEMEIQHQRMVGFRLAHDEGVQAPGVLEAVRRANRAFGADYYIALNTLRIGPETFVALVTHMHEHPADRAWLETPGGPDAVRRFAPAES